MNVTSASGLQCNRGSAIVKARPGDPFLPDAFPLHNQNRNATMARKLITILLVGAASFGLAACGTSPGGRAVSGGLLGAGAGAGVSALTGGSVGTGALVGGGVGAAGGALTAPRRRY
jgi:hypothetical protein